MIQFRQISKQYNDGAKTLALDGVDLSIRDGEFVFITGDSGAGKSTLVKLLMGMEKPTSGSIIVDGLNVAQLERSRLPQYRRRFGCIYQDFQLLSDFTAYGRTSKSACPGRSRKSAWKRRQRAILPSFPAASSSALRSRVPS